MGIYSGNCYRVLKVRIKNVVYLVQDSFLSQHVLELTRGESVLDIVLSSQKEFVDDVKICEPDIFYHQIRRNGIKNTVQNKVSQRKT